MPRRTQPTGDSVPPTLTAAKAIELLTQQLSRVDEITRLRHDNSEVGKWMLTTESILRAAFGKPEGQEHPNVREFTRYRGGGVFPGMTDRDFQWRYQNQIMERKAVLESVIEQLQILAPPAAQVAPDRYRFHPEIEKVSGDLFRNGHYREAALNAYIRVIEEVRVRSGIADDGDSLMNHAFGCDKKTPGIQFNSLQTDAERDEQRGIMYLFKGIVGLRNSKAHSNTLFNDPSRAHEYLALASLLLRLLEIATVNSKP
jgi:uncharacterized protein (TIGR02391 family)